MGQPLHPAYPDFHGGAFLAPPIPRTSGMYLGIDNPQAVQQNNDLRVYRGGSLAIPVRDQSRTSACTAFAGTAVRAALTARYHLDRGEDADIGDTPSPRFAYYYTRQLDGDPTVDQGASMASACRVYVDYGVSPARFDPWDSAAASRDDLAWLNQAPSPEAQAGAQFFGASGYARLSGQGASLLASILQCLADSYPPLIAFSVYQSFMNTGPNGRAPMPTATELRGRPLGGHAMACFASFADQSAPGSGWLLCQNSWTQSFGEDGWVYLPWAYVTTGVLSESWTVR